MPLFGRLDVAPMAPRLAQIKDLDSPPWPLPRAEILQLAWEVSDESLALLPRAMHPAVPAYATLLVTVCPESPVGPFNLAQLRLMGRAGAHPRGYVLAAIASTAEAVHGLRQGWGFPAVLGSVVVRRYHDQITAVVTQHGQPVIEAALVDPEPISGSDVQYIHSVTLARRPEGEAAAPFLVQVDPHYTLHRAERGRPRLRRFERDACNAEPLAPLHPIAASFTAGDTDLPQIRFVMDADLPVTQGTRKIR